MAVIREIKKQSPTIHVTGAISNISFNLPARKSVNMGFTVMAMTMTAGLDNGILDPTDRDLMGIIYATEALMGEDDYCVEYIRSYRQGIHGSVKK